LDDIDDAVVRSPDAAVEFVPAAGVDVVAPLATVLSDEEVGESGVRVNERRRTTSAATAVATFTRNPSSARRC